MSVFRMSNVGGLVSAQVGTLPKNDDGSAAVEGTGIDRHAVGNAQSVVLVASCGAATGSPTAQTFDAKIQHSTASASGYADLTGAAITQITADDQIGYVDVDLTGANRYIRVVHTVTFTGGSSPAIPVATELIFGGATAEPLT